MLLLTRPEPRSTARAFCRLRPLRASSGEVCEDVNWDAIGAIAELLGSTGVIASLIYLVTQIWQSRVQKTTRVSYA